MRVTPQYLKKLIAQAIDSGASSEDIDKLKSYLEQVESGKLNSLDSGDFIHTTTDSQGRTVVRQSTAPVIAEDDSDFAGLTFRSCSA